MHRTVLIANTGSGWQMSTVKAGTDSGFAITGLAAIGRLPRRITTTSNSTIKGLWPLRVKIAIAPFRAPRPLSRPWCRVEYFPDAPAGTRPTPVPSGRFGSDCRRACRPGIRRRLCSPYGTGSTARTRRRPREPSRRWCVQVRSEPRGRSDHENRRIAPRRDSDRSLIPLPSHRHSPACNAARTPARPPQRRQSRAPR